MNDSMPDPMLESIDPYLLALSEGIDKHGWVVQGVFATEDCPGPTFCYTIGLTDKGLPELVMYGLNPELMSSLLNDVAKHMIAAPEFGPAWIGGEVRLPGIIKDFDLLLRGPIDGHKAEANLAYHLFMDPTFCQVMWPDPNGLFPIDPEYFGVGLDQPVLEAP